MRQVPYENKLFIKTVSLVYVGEGITLAGVPARDLTPEEVTTYGGYTYLVETGLYMTQKEALGDGGKDG